MRMWTLVMALAVAVSVPASAATKKPVAMTVSNFEACEQKAIDQGLVHGQNGHNEFVRECMGQRPGNSRSTGN
jgi:hypothetical protein